MMTHQAGAQSHVHGGLPAQRALRVSFGLVTVEGSQSRRLRCAQPGHSTPVADTPEPDIPLCRFVGGDGWICNRPSWRPAGKPNIPPVAGYGRKRNGFFRRSINQSGHRFLVEWGLRKQRRRQNASTSAGSASQRIVSQVVATRRASGSSNAHASSSGGGNGTSKISASIFGACRAWARMT